MSIVVCNGKKKFIYNCCAFCVGSEKCRTCSRKTGKKKYEKRKAKGVKTFEIKVGDTVYKQQMKNVSRKGGKMEPDLMGPYRYWYSNKTNH